MKIVIYIISGVLIFIGLYFLYRLFRFLRFNIMKFWIRRNQRISLERILRFSSSYKDDKNDPKYLTGLSDRLTTYVRVFHQGNKSRGYNRMKVVIFPKGTYDIVEIIGGGECPDSARILELLLVSSIMSTLQVLNTMDNKNYILLNHLGA